MLTKINKKISFCTVCMNRLHHLKQTLPKNIEDNIAYDNIEFVLLNYNSKDDIDNWVQKEMSEYIESGVLKYYKTTEPEVFHMSHSKNVVARCATGDIICNIDADNFTGKGFAEFVNQKFFENNNIFLTTDMLDSIRDCCGRICIKKEDFHKSRGYDENMKTYGFEDEDLKNRLQMFSINKKKIEDKSFLTAIHHNDEERLQSDKSFSEFEAVFVRHDSYASFIVLFIFKNSKYFVGEVLTNRFINSESIENLFIENRNYEYKYSLFGDKWETGTWIKNNNKLMLKSPPKILLTIEEKFAKSHEDFYLNIDDIELIRIEDSDEVLNLTMFFSQITNRNKMKNNKKNKIVVANKNSYGKANLIKNFKENVQLN